MGTQSWGSGTADKIMNCFFRSTGNSITSPTAVYIKLHTNANSSAGPGSDGKQNPSTETTQPSVAFAASSGGQIKNNGTGGAWASAGVSGAETISFFSMWDTSNTTGNFILSGAISPPVLVNPGDPISFAANAL